MDSIALRFIRFPAGVLPFSLAEEIPSSPLISKSAGEPPSVARFAPLNVFPFFHVPVILLQDSDTPGYPGQPATLNWRKNQHLDLPTGYATSCKQASSKREKRPLLKK
jgi:hypothetical protein